jgi:RHS repeat-associated protein
VTQVTQPDGSLLKTAYCGNTTLVTDEAGHWRRSTVDGLGRLNEVDEPNSTTATVNSNGCPGTSEPIWVTTYGYDTLGNLLSAVQAGSRQRNFTYDSLSRLLTAANPESGTLTYTYDADSNVTTKVTPLQNHSSGTATLSYCYDSLNRMTSKAYTNQSCPMTTPVATYSYDGTACLGQASCYNIGHRTGMTDAAGSESWAYDTIGRTVVQSRTTNSITKTTNYTYNLDSSVATLTYPSGRVVTYTPDTAGRPSNVEDNTTSVYYATGTCANDVLGNGACYAPQGAVALLQNGSSLVSTHIYNDRLQPCWMYSTTGTALAWGNTTGCSSTATAGNMLDLKYNFNLGSDNGNPISITNNRVTDLSQTFSYDQLNRISAAQTTATHSSDPTDCWGQAFGYDFTGNWSNLLSISGVSSSYNGCTQGSLSVAVNTKNQITGDTYDAAGNLMTIPGTGGATYVFNAENQMTSTSNSTTQYVYDGDGNRVEKSGSKIYWYGGSNVLDETDTTGSVTNSSFNEYIFFGGSRVARRDSSGNVFYYLTDQLGTSRVIAEVPSGQTIANLCYDADFEPFGGEHTYTNTCPNNYKFTGKERDSESNLDYFGKRYYTNAIGRFSSIDPGPYSWSDPQTLNRYAYTRNNPLRYVDPTGMYFVVAAEMQPQIKQYISTMLRSPQGAAMIHSIAASNKPSSFNQGPLDRHQILGTNRPSIENGASGPVAGNQPGQLAGTQTTLSNSNIAFTAGLTTGNIFAVGLNAFAHEDAHVVDMLAAPTFQGALAAAHAGDDSSQPGAEDTMGGTAQSRASQVMGELGGAGQSFQADAQTDAEAAGIILSGMRQFAAQQQVELEVIPGTEPDNNLPLSGVNDGVPAPGNAPQ